MNSRFSLLLLFCLLTVTGLANSGPHSLTPFKAEYTAYKWGQKLGKASMELQWLAGNQYSLVYRSEASKFFLSDKRTEHSIFYFEDNKFTPKEYYYTRKGTGKDKALAVKFIHDQKRIEIQGGDEGTTLPWTDESDNQLYRIALPLALAAKQEQYEVNFINYRGEQKQYKIAVDKTEVLSLPYGEIDAIKVKIVRQQSSRETYAWFAPKLDYLLVRLQQFKKGKEQGDVRLKSFTQFPIQF